MTTSTQWAVTTFAYSPANSASYAALGCNLVVNNLGINDADAPTGVSQYIANMQTLTTAQQGAGADVLIMTPVPSNPSGGGAPVATQYAYMQALRNLALTDNVALADVNLRYGSYASAVNYNVYFDAFVHQQSAGYLDNASTVLSVISPPKQSNVPLAGAWSAPLNLVGNLLSAGGRPSSLLTLKNLMATDYAFVDFFSSNATPYDWRLGVSNAFNNFLLYDNNTGKFPLEVNTSDNVGIDNACSAITPLEVCGAFTATGPMNVSQTLTTVVGSTSGTAAFAMPFQGTSFKKVDIHLNALLGTASFTFPVSFTNSPVTVINSSTATLSITGTGPYTGVTVTGSTSTGFITLEEQN